MNKQETNYSINENMKKYSKPLQEDDSIDTLINLANDLGGLKTLSEY